MSGQILYLDSSAVIKRYIKEPGSDFVRDVYVRAYSGDASISYSIWNIGEVLGAFDKARNTGRIDERAYEIVKSRFLLETRRMMKLGIAVIVPLKLRILREGWKLIERYHVYEADAIQIASAKYVGSSQFLTGDRQLHEIAVEEGIDSVYLG